MQPRLTIRELASWYSDLYKEVYGFRLRVGYDGLTEGQLSDPEWLMKAISRMQVRPKLYQWTDGRRIGPSDTES